CSLWSRAYHVVILCNWTPQPFTLCFFAIAIPSSFLLRALWKKTNMTPGKYYRFHFSQILLVILGIVYATTVLFLRRPNQDDVVYFHRALTQLLDLNQPIYLRQTSVDMDAAAFSPVHLSTS